MEGGRPVGENLEELYALKREILPRLQETPYVLEDKPAVLAWYPTAKLAVLWNLSNEPVELTVRLGTADRTIHCKALDLECIDFAAK